MKRTLCKRLTATLLTMAMLLTGMALTPASVVQVEAASADYPAQLVRIGTSDGSKNLNISAMADNSPCNTWATNGSQNENWRFDYVGADGTGSYFEIVNMGTGKLLTPLGGKADAGTTCVIYGSDNTSTQQWYVIPLDKDSIGGNLHYKVVNRTNSNQALTLDSDTGKVMLAAFNGADGQKWLLNTAGLQGFGGYCKDMSGNAKASTIGGLLGETVEVKTFDELKNACSDATPRTIVITKNISLTGNYEKDSNGRYRFKAAYIYMYPNKTIIGAYGSNSLYNVYFRTYEGNYGQGNNIIIRNINISHDKELNNDNIWEFSYGTNFWIDHCTFTGHSGVNTASTGMDDWDKFINFKGNCDYISISDCSIGLHEYGVLLGYPTDDLNTYNTYNGKPCVTLADNYYKNCITRAPALMRYGYFHSLNNYVVNFDMGYTIHTAAKLYAEACYYEAGSGKGAVVNDDYMSNGQTLAADKAKCYYTDKGSTAVGCYNNNNVSNIKSSACSWRPASNYSYTAKSAADAKSYCTKYSGAQTSASNMTYAAFSAPGVPSAFYVTEPSEPVIVEPISARLVTNLVVQDTANAQSWSINESLSLNDTLYGDRDVTYKTIPSILAGSEAIITACDGKAFEGTQATFTAGDNLTLFIVLDNRVTSIPSWMSGFKKTGFTASNNNDVAFDLYCMNYKKGDTVTLGTNGQSVSCVNYTVIVSNIIGDVNADGAFNTADIKALKQFLLVGGAVASNDAADLTNDGTLSVIDLAMLERYSMMLLGMTSVEIVTPEPENKYEPSGFVASGKVYLVGDSTVCEYNSTTNTTLNRYGWGMKLAEQYNGISVNNLALSGRSSRSFLTENNYTTLANSIGKGDYLFIQFGHNDEKTDETKTPGLGTFPNLDMSTLDANGKNSSNQYSFEWMLLNKYVKLAQNKGAVPVLITPITRRSTDGKPNYSQHTSYQQAILKLANDNNIAVIDMTALTTELYNNLYNSGGANATAAMHCYSDTSNTTIDNTHLSNAGATKIASIIAAKTKELGLTIGNKVK